MRFKIPDKYDKHIQKSNLYNFLCQKRYLDKKKRYGLNPNNINQKAIPKGTLSILINNMYEKQ